MRWRGGAVRILIVEDDKALVRGLSASLKAMGFAVDHEPDGAEAASIAISEPYSLVVLDLGLPNSSGFEVLRQVRASGSKVPIMILTARDATADKVRGLDLGADDYVRKPFDLPGDGGPENIDASPRQAGAERPPHRRGVRL
jgi:DNA-binding response OmpR family regulator